MYLSPDLIIKINVLTAPIIATSVVPGLDRLPSSSLTDLSDLLKRYSVFRLLLYRCFFLYTRVITSAQQPSS